jgi:hypothetical protein
MSRTKGAKHKQTLDVKELAQDYTADAIAALAKIMTKGKQEASIVAAANSLLDRGHGKPKQNIEGELKGSMTINVGTGVPRA